MRKIFIILVLGFFPGTVLTANAHPVAFKGSTSLMSSNEDRRNEILLSYSLTSSFSAGGFYLQEETRRAAFARTNFLLKRWNNEDSQGNIYLGVGVGAGENKSNLVTSPSETEFASLAALDADWESRKFYVATHYSRYLISNDRDLWDEKKLRLGVAPYLAEFNEINTWFILQFSQNSNDDIQTTQLLRLFYRNSLFEIGAQIGGGWAFNYMVHF